MLEMERCGVKLLGNHMSLDQVIYELRKDRNKQFIDNIYN